MSVSLTEKHHISLHFHHSATASYRHLSEYVCVTNRSTNRKVIGSTPVGIGFFFFFSLYPSMSVSLTEKHHIQVITSIFKY